MIHETPLNLPHNVIVPRCVLAASN